MKISKRFIKETSKLALLLSLGTSIIQPTESKADATLGFAIQNGYKISVTPPKGVTGIKGYKVYWGLGDDADNGVYPFSKDIGNNRTTLIDNMPLATNISFAATYYNDSLTESPKSIPAKTYSFKQVALALGKYSTTNMTPAKNNAQCYVLTLEGPKNPPFFKGFRYYLDSTNNPAKEVQSAFTMDTTNINSRNTIISTFIVPTSDVNPDPVNRNIFFRQKFEELTLSPPKLLRAE